MFADLPAFERSLGSWRCASALNVAVTRARETMTVVSSLARIDIETTEVRQGTGLEFLRNFLQYAGRKGTIIAHGELSHEQMKESEADI